MDKKIIIGTIKDQVYKYLKDEICNRNFTPGYWNVGKSSLINRLLGRKNLARTSGSPGKTRTINFYNVKAMAAGLASFQPAAHRMAPVALIGGVNWIAYVALACGA